MAIYENNREFQKIYNDINPKFDQLPIRFVRSISCTMVDGQQLKFSNDEIEDDTDQDDLRIADLLTELDLYPYMKSCGVEPDIDKFEREINGMINSMWEELLENNEGNHSM